MTGKIALFLLGVLVGYGAHDLHSRVEGPAANVVAIEPRQDPASAPVVVAAQVDSELATFEPDAAEESERPSDVPPEAENPEYTTHLNLEEEIVRDMEDSREELRRNAYTIPTGDGWKLRINHPDKLFSKVGLNDGDLITSEGIEAQLNDPQKVQLAHRVLEILRFLER